MGLHSPSAMGLLMFFITLDGSATGNSLAQDGQNSRQARTALTGTAAPCLADSVPVLSALPLLSYQVSRLKQDDHELPGLAVWVAGHRRPHQFTRVHASGLSSGANAHELR